MKFLILLLIVFSITTVSAQQVTSEGYETVIVHKDPRFDELAAKQAELNKQHYLRTPRTARGFRIQVANTQNRDEANTVKAELLRKFPDQKSYLLYQAPSFRVRIGNFLTQKDAFKLRKQISTIYPDKGIYIVPDIVEYTPPPEEGDEPNN